MTTDEFPRALEVRLTVPVADVSEEHRAEAEEKAREAFVMTLLRHGEISAGRAARILGINRSQLSALMFDYHISPFDDTQTREDLEREVAETLRLLRREEEQQSDQE